MTTSVIEVQRTTSFASFTSQSVTIAATPVAGDVAIVCINMPSGIRTVDTITGLGGTWTRVVGPASSSGRQEYWVGTGVSTSGLVTVTVTSTGTWQFEVYLVRGLTSPITITSDIDTSGSVGALTSTTTAQDGQFVLQNVCTTLGDLTNASVVDPSSGWTVLSKIGTTGNPGNQIASAYRNPDEGVPTTHSVTSSMAASGTRSQTIVTFGLPTIPPDSYAASVIADTPLVYWRLDETSGVLLDSSGNGRNSSASPSNVTRGQTGAVDGGFSIIRTGTSTAGASRADEAALDVTQVTVDALFRTSITAQEQWIGGKWGASSANTSIALRINSSNVLQVGFRTDTTSSAWYADSLASNVTDDQWHHVAATWDPTSDTLRLYLDGSEVGNFAVAGTTVYVGTGALFIGSREVVGAMVERLDDFAFYGTALSAARIFDHAVAAGVVPPMVNDTLPTISGTTTEGEILTATAGTWTPTPDSTAYQWLRDGVAIDGATASTYTLVAADVDTMISVQVTVSAAGFTDGVATSVEVGPVAAAPPPSPPPDAGPPVRWLARGPLDVALTGSMTPEEKAYVLTASTDRLLEGWPDWHPRFTDPIDPPYDGHLAWSGSAKIYDLNPVLVHPERGYLNLGAYGVVKDIVSEHRGTFEDFAIFQYDSTIPYYGDDPVEGHVLADNAGTSTGSGDLISSWSRHYRVFYPPKAARYAVPHLILGSVAAGKGQYLDAFQMQVLPIVDPAEPTTFVPPRQIKVRVKPTRLNYSLNPSFVVSTAGIETEGSVTLTQDTTRSRVGGTCLKIVVDTGASPVRVGEDQDIEVMDGEDLTISFAYSADTTLSGTYQVMVRFYTQAGTLVSTEYGDTLHERTNGWETRSLSTTVPDGATLARVSHAYSETDPASSDTFYIDTVLIEKEARVREFFDGSSGEDYLWRQDGVAGLTWSYYYEDRATRHYILERTLRENVPLGVSIADPEYAAESLG